MSEADVTTSGIVLGEEFLENKSVEELEKDLEAQKQAQDSLIKQINKQWYKEEWDRDKFLNFNKNINLIYWRIKEMKKVSD